MNRNKLLVLSLLVILSVFFIFRYVDKKNTSNSKSALSETEEKFYYTCPMHPQIHQDHPGECPICHMKLVKVLESGKNEKSLSDEAEKRTSIHASQNQLELIGVQKTSPEKMSLTAKIPVSGRLLNNRTVAFYIYEKDLINIKPGLRFKGDSSVKFETEISGVITSIDTIVDPTTRTIRVLGQIQNGPQGLMAETSFSGEVLLELKNRLVIPESSVLHTGRGDLVYLIEKDNRLTPKYIKLGTKAEGYYVVLSGLTETDEISSGPNFLIDSESKIRGAND